MSKKRSHPDFQLIAFFGCIGGGVGIACADLGFWYWLIGMIFVADLSFREIWRDAGEGPRRKP